MGKKVANDGSRKTVLKPSLTVPFRDGISWPVIGKIENRRIIAEIKQELSKIAVKRPPSKGKNTKGKKRKSNILPQRSKLYLSELMLVGINAVTKALERGPISLVMVCNSARPVEMTHHLISLCAMRNTPGCCLAGLSKTLSEILGIRSALAVGFMKNSPLQDLLDFIKDKTPPLIVPWVNIWKDDPLLRKEACTKENVDDFVACDERDGITKVDKSGPILSSTMENQIKDSRMSDKKEDCIKRNIALDTDDSRIASDNDETPKGSSDFYEHKRGEKRKLDDVGCMLYDANFKFKEVSIRIKKKNKMK